MRRRLVIGGLVVAALVCAGIQWGSNVEEEPATAVAKRPTREKKAPKRKAPDRVAQEAAAEEVAEEGERAVEEVEAPAVWIVHGLVVDSAGDGVPGVNVTCLTGEGPKRRRTDREGRFDMKLGAPGACRAWRRDGVLIARSDEAAVGGPPNSEVDLEFVLPTERTGGIGISFEATEEGMRILEVHPDTPAGRAGLEAGDLIIEVDGLPTATLDSWQFIETMTGPEGTGVTFAVAYATDTGTAVEEHRVFRSYLVKGEDGKVRSAPTDTGGG